MELTYFGEYAHVLSLAKPMVVV